VAIKQIVDGGQSKLSSAKKEIESERANLLSGLVEEEKEIVEKITEKLIGAKVRINLDSATVRRALEEAS
jgi:F0F1-type ATP synthase membrane subunit b/b'